MYMFRGCADNQGPVTVIFDSKDRKTRSGAPSASASGASTPVKGSAEALAIAKAKNDAKKAKKAEYEARKAAGEIPHKE